MVRETFTLMDNLST